MCIEIVSEDGICFTAAPWGANSAALTQLKGTLWRFWPLRALWSNVFMSWSPFLFVCTCTHASLPMFSPRFTAMCHKKQQGSNRGSEEETACKLTWMKMMQAFGFTRQDQNDLWENIATAHFSWEIGKLHKAPLIVWWQTFLKHPMKHLKLNLLSPRVPLNLTLATLFILGMAARPKKRLGLKPVEVSHGNKCFMSWNVCKSLSFEKQQ